MSVLNWGCIEIYVNARFGLGSTLMKRAAIRRLVLLVSTRLVSCMVTCHCVPSYEDGVRYPRPFIVFFLFVVVLFYVLIGNAVVRLNATRESGFY